MSTSSRIAVSLDELMLTAGNLTAIAPAGTLDSVLQSTPQWFKDGPAVAADLGGRFLCRYLLPSQQGQFTNGTNNPTYLTPTAFTPEEASTWLSLPSPLNLRTLVLFIDPALITQAAGYRILGPRRVLLGGGIEYVLPDGFPGSALVPVAVGNNAVWEIQVT